MKFQTLLLSTLGLFAYQASWANPVTVNNAWVRPTVPGQSVAGAYLDITAKQSARLIAASSPISPDVQIHWMQMDGDVMRMREVSAIELPKNRTVSLKPNGYHLMLMKLKKPIQAGETVPLTLVIETQRKRHSVKVNALAQPQATEGSHDAHDHAHKHH